MYEEISLNGLWDLRDEPLSHPLDDVRRLTSELEGWIDQPVPGDIHQGLVTAGRIAPPLIGLNSFDCRWTEHRSWWFRKRFEVDPAWLEADVIELEMQGLDANAVIFVNGTYVDAHTNAFRPFARDIKPWLHAGENTLLVRLTAGVETVSELEVDHCNGVRASTEAGNGRPERGDPRRIYARKPQYSWGWDWSPRVPTTAIAGDVTLRAMSTATIRDVALHPIQLGDDVTVEATILVDQFHYYQTREGWVSVTLTDAAGRSYQAEVETLLRSGYTYVTLRIPISEPRLWWPAGLGDQHRYRVEATLTVGEAQIAYPTFHYGIRFLALDTRDTFAFVVNGRRVYAKGANWIPADAIYARLTDETYEMLVREAAEANFNMLRIWGGGLYEPDAFYEACDRYGIMLWHDFMFACAPYPDDLPAFRQEVEREADYQTRRLRRYASIVLWCGNNENTWGFRDWWHERTQCGAFVYNYILPSVVQRNVPEVPYWTSSPYGGESPNDPDVGDRHHWHDAMMNADMEKRITPEVYDETDARFISEFGYIGAPTRQTVLDYMEGPPVDRTGKAWQHHTNTFEKDTVAAGIAKHYVDPETLSTDEYLLYSGLVQGLMYSYALDSMRARDECYGSLFWMFEDCWGEVGWTIIDYGRRRKPAWYYVRRAYAPLRLILRPGDEGQIRLILANDTAEAVSFDVTVGWVSLDGKVEDLNITTAAAPALSRAQVITFAKGDRDPTQGFWIARATERPDVPTAFFRAVDYRQLNVPAAHLDVEMLDADTTACRVRVTSDVYAHAVRLILPPGATPEDDFFDLLPGETHEVVVTAPEPIPANAISVHCLNEVA